MFELLGLNFHDNGVFAVEGLAVGWSMVLVGSDSRFPVQGVRQSKAGHFAQNLSKHRTQAQDTRQRTLTRGKIRLVYIVPVSGIFHFCVVLEPLQEKLCSKKIFEQEKFSTEKVSVKFGTEKKTELVPEKFGTENKYRYRKNIWYCHTLI